MQLLGARYYLPQLGRFLTQDPIGHEGGLNLYAYCGDSPLTRVDPDGKDWNSFSNWISQGFNKHVITPFKGWNTAIGRTGAWAMGVGPDHMRFGANSLEVKQMIASDIGFNIDMAIIGAGYMREGRQTIRGSSGSLMPFISTLAQPSNGTQAFIGGYTWSASRYGNTIAINVHNETSMNSAFYHWLMLSNWKGWDRASNGFGPMGTTYQDYTWTIPVPSYWRR